MYIKIWEKQGFVALNASLRALSEVQNDVRKISALCRALREHYFGSG